ncbi:glucomannan 4-beta-mannosyltransferase 1-like isoform X2 [Olea europaea var. sylvestris]|uniref:glucomannan 4-beta-mannosyltransferase 1-like isoform X2 n=1 Tax=Olea europaea var. sylvestris TaxID=158386 RepID=UPI000C1CE30B|nr:glucomannan 4-beta-mannosyltransferase 1-like isoform X2 [Olea europaea var. sylvestris]
MYFLIFDCELLNVALLVQLSHKFCASPVKSEIPSMFKAFRFQQHRWFCGPANLFRKMVMEIAKNKKVSLWKKFYVIYNFFVRKIIAHTFTFISYYVVLPLTILVPEVDVLKWGAIYIPCIITALNSVGTPRSFHLLFYWVLFENVMSFHCNKATIMDLLEAKRANEWVVTEKLADALKNKSNAKPADLLRNLRVECIYIKFVLYINKCRGLVDIYKIYLYMINVYLFLL